MKTKQLLTLLVVLVVLLLLAFVARSRRASNTGDSGSETSADREKVFPSLNVNDIAKLSITDADGTVNVEKGESGWTLAERDGYAADFGRLREIIKSVGDLKIAQGMAVSDSALGRLGLIAPGTEGADPEKVAKKVDLLGADGTSLGTLLIGKEPNSGSGGPGNGRIVKAATDEGKAWDVSESFSQVSTKASDWISKDFIKLDKVKSIKLDGPADYDWSASREDESGTFALAEVAEGKETDPSKVSSFNYLLSSPSFTDLLEKEEAAKLDFAGEEAYKATLEAFDGFTYNLEILADRGDEPTASEPKEGEEAPAPTPPKGYFVKVDVSAELKETRDPVEGEEEEAKKAADEAFAKALEEKKEKLAKEQALKGHVYKVSEYTFTSLLKKKSDLIKDEPVPEPEEEKPAPVEGGASPESPDPGLGAKMLKETLENPAPPAPAEEGGEKPAEVPALEEKAVAPAGEPEAKKPAETPAPEEKAAEPDGKPEEEKTPVEKAAEIIKDNAKEAASEAKEAAKEAAAASAEVVEKAGDAAKKGAAEVKETAKKAGEAAKEAAEKAGSTVKEGTEKAAGAAKKGAVTATEAAEKTGEAAAKATDAAAEGAKKAGEASKKAGKGALDALKEAGKAAKESAKSAGKAAAEVTKEAGAAAADGAKTVGEGAKKAAEAVKGAATE